MTTPDDEARRKAKAAVQDMLDTYKYIMLTTNYTGYDVELMTKLRLVDAGPEGWVEWELDITDFYANQNGVMHGGAAGVIFDMCTTTALCPVAKPGYWDFQGGVTRTLDVSYLRAVPLHSTVRIRSEVLQHGRTMALIRGTMTDGRGKVLATCEHHKVNVDAKKEHLVAREEMRREIQRRGDRSWLDAVRAEGSMRVERGGVKL